jgi:hypothetical protein
MTNQIKTKQIKTKQNKTKQNKTKQNTFSEACKAGMILQSLRRA